MADNGNQHDRDRQLEDRLANYRERIAYPSMGDSAGAARTRIESERTAVSHLHAAQAAAIEGWNDDPDEPIATGGITDFQHVAPKGGLRRTLSFVAAALAVFIVAGALVVILPNIAGDGNGAAGVLGPETTGYQFAGTLGGSLIPNQPVAVALDAAGNIYSADIATRSVHKFDPDGKHLASYTAEESEFGAFIRPWDVAIQDDQLYVLDQRQMAAYVLSLDGEVRGAWPIGDPDDQGNFLTGLDVDAQGNAYIARANEGIIAVYDADGVPIRDIVVTTDVASGGGRPADVAVDSDGMVYVTTFEGNVVRVFAPDGSAIDEWTNIDIPSQISGGVFGVAVASDVVYVNSERGIVQLSEAGDVINTISVDVSLRIAGTSPPGSVGLDSAGNAYMAVPDEQRIVGISPTGEPVLHIADERTDRFAFPAGIHITSEGTLYVTDTLKKHLVAFNVDSAEAQLIPWETGQFVPPNPAPSGDVVIADDQIYLLDGPDSTVLALTEDRETRLEFGGSLVGDDPWNRPAVLGIDVREDIYVLDNSALAIFKYDSDGNFLHQFDQAAVGSERSSPMAMDVQDDVVYVAFINGSEPGIWSLDIDGKPLERVVEFHHNEDQLIDVLATSIAVAQTGDIFAFDNSSRSVNWYDPDGDLKSEWAIDAGFDGANTLVYIAVDETGTVYVSDGESRQILIYEPLR